ncbi:MAG TPA: phosphoglycerate dehydrogenase [Blastocatellia bacterium]|nr:phosphoglycerate dehydrogenase [Blastocatellia bacterium]
MRILVCDGLEKSGVDKLRAASGIAVDERPDLSGDELIRVIGDYDGLVVRSKSQVTGAVLDAGKKLKVVARAGTGVDNVDVATATRRGIIVMNAADGNTVTTAEHAVAMLMALARQIPQATASMKAGKWEKKRFLGTELMGKTLGVVGVGKIGRAVAQRATGIGMSVIGFDPYFTGEAASKLGIEMLPLDELLPRADFITVHTPLTEETRGIIGREAFKKMKDGVRVINCARGGLVDEKALAEAMKSGKVAGAALDVFEQEPPPKDNPLLGLDEVIVTPHLGASTEEAQISVANIVAEQLIEYFKQGSVRGAVNVPAISPEVLSAIGAFIALGEKIGQFQGQVFGHELSEVNVEYSGEVAEQDVRPITQAILTGLLSPVIERINFVNAGVVAEERGIKVTESLSRRAKDFTSLINVRAVTSSGESEVAGSVMGRRDPRIVRINGFNLEAIPKGHMLFILNRDVPGVLGRIASFIGDQKINIGRLYLGRKKVGENALALIQIDEPLPPAALKELGELQSVVSVQQVSL